MPEPRSRVQSHPVHAQRREGGELIGGEPWGKRQSHPHLCEDCQTRAVTAEQQAEARAEEFERQEREQERLRQEAEGRAAAQKAGGWFSRFRT
ncbi:hypothetical protein [Streptomyces sp. NPDC059970]|uniref:hypothetical protein n=1 Tax=Streptomyces sp. NPDC059970 TaxID=3347019 RepID=UPI003690EABF